MTSLAPSPPATAPSGRGCTIPAAEPVACVRPSLRTSRIDRDVNNLPREVGRKALGSSYVGDNFLSRRTELAELRTHSVCDLFCLCIGYWHSTECRGQSFDEVPRIDLFGFGRRCGRAGLAHS